MPFKSEKQRKWMHANEPEMAKKWEKEEKSVEEDRDYKAEYKKYGSSTKAKKYRAELNKYNRQKGTYGNGDGKDASHKGGKIVGFEAESKNRGRAEKSRLKQETVNEVGELIPKTKVRLLKMNAKYLADDLMDMYKELSKKHDIISPALIIQHLDTLKDKVKMMRKNVGLRESVNEARGAASNKGAAVYINTFEKLLKKQIGGTIF